MNRFILFATPFLLVSALLLQGCAAVVIGAAAVGGATLIHERRSTGTVIDDQKIELSVLQRLSDEPEIAEHSDISVTSYNFSVLLTGEADTASIKRRAARLVSKVPKVKRVVDEVTVGSSPSMATRSNDLYVTSNAKLALFNVEIEGFDPSRVKVVTRRGRVYLMGLVTREEGDAATEVVRRLHGVNRVVKVFEYIDSK